MRLFANQIQIVYLSGHHLAHSNTNESRWRLVRNAHKADRD